jgi:hypothetical protein
MFESMIVVVVQNIFYLKIHQNNFFIFKKIFLISAHQNDINTTKKFKFLKNMVSTAFPNTVSCENKFKS